MTYTLNTEGVYAYVSLLRTETSKKYNNKAQNPSDPLDFQSVTGGEYKAQVQIHRGVLIHDY